jgi:hypothetical protein
MNSETNKRLAIINNGPYKNKACLILEEVNCVTTDHLKWFRILLDNKVLLMSNKNIKFI